MTEPHDTKGGLRVRRVEIVDEVGDVRAVLGVDEYDCEVGLALLGHDAAGKLHKRACLAVDDLGPELDFRFGGNTPVQIGVFDAGRDVVRPGPYVVLTDWDGLSASAPSNAKSTRAVAYR